MGIPPHVLSTVVLSLSREIASNGLTRICKEQVHKYVTATTKEHRIEIIFQVCQRAICLLRDYVELCLQRILFNHHAAWSLQAAAVALIFHTEAVTSPEDLVLNLDVEEGIYGRQAVAVTGVKGGIVPRGSVLLRERALSVAVHAPSSPHSSHLHQTTKSACEDSSVTVLPAHLQLAWHLVVDTNSKSRHECSRNHRSSSSGSCTLNMQTKSAVELFLDHCRPPALLQPKVEPQETNPDNSSLEQKAWQTSLPSLVVMAVASCLCAVLACHAPRVTAGSDCKGKCEDMRLDDVQMFEVLRRLPHNTHAISAISAAAMTPQSSNNYSVVSQSSHGIGIFPIASSLNHSCVANTVVKFYISNGDSKCDEPNCYLELVASRDITSGEELCLSYGPTSVMPLAARQQHLWEQYLFQCQCSLCREEMSASLEEVDDCGNSHISGDAMSMAEMERSCIVWAKGVWLIIDSLREHMVQNRLTVTHTTLASIRKNLLTCLGELNTEISKLHCAEVKFSCAMSSPCLRHMTEIEHTLYDMLGQVCACSSDYSSALAYTQRGVEIYIRQHCTLGSLPVDDILVAREEVKVVQLLLACGQVKECAEMADKVRRNMRPFIVEDSDPDYVEISNIIEMLTLNRAL